MELKWQIENNSEENHTSLDWYSGEHIFELDAQQLDSLTCLGCKYSNCFIELLLWNIHLYFAFCQIGFFNDEGFNLLYLRREHWKIIFNLEMALLSHSTILKFPPGHYTMSRCLHWSGTRVQASGKTQPVTCCWLLTSCRARFKMRSFSPQLRLKGLDMYIKNAISYKDFQKYKFQKLIPSQNLATKSDCTGVHCPPMKVQDGTGLTQS